MSKSNEPFEEFLEALRKALAPYEEVRQKIRETLAPSLELQSKIDKILEPIKDIRASHANLAKAFEPLIARVELIEKEYGSLSNFLNEIIEERHQELSRFGWFYAFGISDDLADEVFTRRNTITQNEVDAIVIDYFKEDNYSGLSKIVSNWNNSPFFTSRSHIFDEALNNHVQGHFYSSVTLLSVHTEGVISDYIRKESGAKRSLSQYIKDLETLLDKNQSKTYFPEIERRVLFDFLTNVCTSSFWCEYPEWQDSDKLVASHNLSRNKIAHGHVIVGLAESDSLKCFLYLDALFRLFLQLSNGGDSDE